MCSRNVLRVLSAIRDIVGADVKGVGPEMSALLKNKNLRGMDNFEILAGIEESESYGLVTVVRGTPAGQRLGVPVEFRGIVGVNILEAGQELLD